MRYYWLILSILCVWRVTHLLQAEDGPGFHGSLPPARSGLFGNLLDCFYCLSVWIAAVCTARRKLEGASTAMAGAVGRGDFAGACHFD